MAAHVLDGAGVISVWRIFQVIVQRSANNAPASSFRISCDAGEMVGVEACLSKDLKYQACSASVRECPASNVLLRAPK